MNIVVCVKYVPDAQADRTFVASDKTTDRVGVDGLLSELDEYADRGGAQARRAEAGDGEVTVLTVGPEQAADALKKALQMGADKAVHVVDDAIHGSDALATSLVLAKAIGKLDPQPDLVMTGMASTDGIMGVVPAMLAERLGLPAGDVRVGADRRGRHGHGPPRRRRRLADHRGDAAGPGVGHRPDQQPRYPSFKGIMAAKKKPVDTWSLADLGIEPSEVGLDAAWTKVESYAARPPRQKGQIVTDEGDGGEKLAEFLAEHKFV